MWVVFVLVIVLFARLRFNIQSLWKLCNLHMESHCNCNGDSLSSSSSMETVDDLLEECWFFQNLFKRRTANSAMMLRCNTDPCPSSAAASKMSQDLLPRTSESENTSTTEKKRDGGVHRDLTRAPSLPPCRGRKKENKEEKESNDGTNKLTGQTSHQNMLQEPKPNCKEKKQRSYEEKGSESRSKLCGGQSSRRRLQRAPSLPPNIGREDIINDKESEARMSRLIQQAFANSSESPKGIPRLRPLRSLEVLESNNTNGIKEMRRRYLNQPKMMRKSLNDLETEEVQGFRDLGFAFEKTDLSTSVVNMLPGLQEKKQEELKQDNNKMRGPYLSEAWMRQSCAIPSVPNWVAKKSAEDMKAQLKFWAQAVASNVR